MAKSQVMTGSRALVFIGDKLAGVFTNCSWSIRQDKVPQFILGRYNPAEITPLSQEAVQLTLMGYRVFGKGPYALKAATMLKNLLQEDDFVVTILDRQNPDPKKPLFRAVGCRVMGWSSGVAAKGFSDIRLDVVGIRAEDETSSEGGGDNDTASATNLT